MISALVYENTMIVKTKTKQTSNEKIKAPTLTYPLKKKKKGKEEFGVRSTVILCVSSL